MKTPFRIRSIVARCALALVVAACVAAHAADLTVSAAASLSNAFRELGPLFEAQNAGTRVVFNFAASDALLAQIAKGAPADVFAAADQESMDRADAQRLLASGSRRNFVSNSLVLIAPADSTLIFTSLADLQKAEVRRITLGTPSGVPAGRYAKAALDAARLWAAVEPKAVYAQNVRQSLDYVARGEVEAGFVYATDASTRRDTVKVALAVPTGTTISYPAAAIAGSPNPDAARRFVDFLITPAAQTVLARHGFGKP
jgi:molybdate transport system substrate-binding protein